MWFTSQNYVCVTARLKIVRIYARSVFRIHGHKRYWLIAVSTID